MYLDHPEVATRPCEECKKWFWNDDGTRKKRGGKPIPNLSGVTPCRTCPKKSPAEAKEYELSPRNIRVVALYYQVRATVGNCLTERECRDPILMRNLATVDRIVRSREKQQLAVDLATILSGPAEPANSSRQRR